MNNNSKRESSFVAKGEDPVSGGANDTSSNEASYSTPGIPLGAERAQALSMVIEERQGAIEAARAIARLNADWLARICVLAQQLEKVYLAEISSTALSYRERSKRMKDYVKLQSELFEMFHTANLDYLHCNGIYRDHVSILAEAGNVAGGGPNEQPKTIEELEAEFKEAGTRLKKLKLMRRFEEKVVERTGTAPSSDPECRKFRESFAEMMVQKNERFGIPLPGGDIDLPVIDMGDSGVGNDDEE